MGNKKTNRRDTSNEYKRDLANEQIQLENSKTAHLINDMNAGGSRGGRPVKGKDDE